MYATSGLARSDPRGQPPPQSVRHPGNPIGRRRSARLLLGRPVLPRRAAMKYGTPRVRLFVIGSAAALYSHARGAFRRRARSRLASPLVASVLRRRQENAAQEKLLPSALRRGRARAGFLRRALLRRVGVCLPACLPAVMTLPWYIQALTVAH